MRKLSFFLAFALVLTFAGGALAQDGVISFDGVTNQYTPTQLSGGNTHVISIRYDFTALAGGVPWGGSNGFELYSPTGADWNYLEVTTGPLVDAAAGTSGSLAFFKKHFYFDGGSWIETGPLNPGDPSGSSPVGGSGGAATKAGYYLAAIDVLGTGGYTGGVDNDIAMYMEFQTNTADFGGSMCFNKNLVLTAWEWTQGAILLTPLYDNGVSGDAERCWEIFEVPNLVPVWCDDPAVGEVTFNHCAEGSFQLCATNPDDIGYDPPTYLFAPGFETGFGDLTAEGAWTWSGPTVPQTGDVDVHFLATDGQGNSATEFVLTAHVLNTPPTISCPAGPLTVSLDVMKSQTITFGDVDVCDAPVLTVINDGGVAGTVAVVGGAVQYTPVAGDELLAQPVVMTVQVDDGVDQATCEIRWNVIAGAPYQISIEKKYAQLQGHFTDVYIKLHKVDITQGIGGFDLLVAYDASALSFQMAYEGDVYGLCGWEYFTYRYGPYGNCGSACPSGMLKVVGLAETNNGPWHPGCDTPDAGYVQTGQLPVDLAYLRFLVSNDRTLECQYVPIRFMWYNCTDNIISNADGTEAYLSQKVFDFFSYDPTDLFSAGEITGDGSQTFPTFQGAPDDCLFEQNGKVAKRNVDFQNGGVDIVCADSIDARGDINLNGLAYEIADAVMFTNYFISGLSAFGTHPDGSIAASDTNADGLALTVADLVYLIRVVIGDALPYDKKVPVVANVTYGNDVFNVDAEMGAAHIVMEGNVTPILLAPNFELKSRFDGENTNMIIFSTKAGASFSGDFLQVDGNIVSTEFATFTGATVAAKVMPSTFVLEQNYPNPFNPGTVIEFAIPGGGSWKLDIYNITGQLVDSFSGVAESGYGTVEWNASDFSSGIYFYRLSAGDYSMTKKAVLLK